MDTDIRVLLDDMDPNGRFSLKTDCIHDRIDALQMLFKAGANVKY